MVVIGYMHYRKKPVKLNRAYAFAAVAKAEGAKLLYFSPGAVDFQKRKISGYVYDCGKWIKTISAFPDVIYNAVGFSKEKQDDVVDKLMDEIPLTSHSIGSKLAVFKNLMKYKKFSDYLIPTEKVLSSEHFFNLIDKYQKVVFKPSMGCQGIDVYYIKKENKSYEIRLDSRNANYDSDKMAEFISDHISKQAYLVQPYINCRTKSGDPYDFRLHVQKNIKGIWVVAKIYPRICSTGSIVCNIHNGGYTTDLNTFLEREFGDDCFYMKKQIEEFSLELATHMDKIQKELCKEELDELGIDIGLDENRKIRIYEINWRPGYPPSMSVDLNVAKNIIHYSIFLASRERRKI